MCFSLWFPPSCTNTHTHKQSYDPQTKWPSFPFLAIASLLKTSRLLLEMHDGSSSACKKFISALSLDILPILTVFQIYTHPSLHSVSVFFNILWRLSADWLDDSSVMPPTLLIHPSINRPLLSVPTYVPLVVMTQFFFEANLLFNSLCEL